jgi:putative ABC transport system permease protein
VIERFRRLVRLPLFTRRSLEREVDEEITFHLAMRTGRLVGRGLPPDEARAEALRRFGVLDSIRDQCLTIDRRHTRRTAMETFVEELVADIRFGLRSLSRSAGLAITALGTLVLGIASITTVFSFVNAGFRPLPYKDANRIVTLNQQSPTGWHMGVSLPVVQYIRETNRSFERLSAFRSDRVDALIGGEAKQLSSLLVDTSFAAMLATPAAIGRFLTRDEILGDASSVVVSDDLWRTLGGDSTVVGRTLRLTQRLYTIVGVMPPGFEYPTRVKAYIPIAMRPDSGELAIDARVTLLGKLRPGIDREAAREEMRRLSTRLTDVDPVLAKHKIAVADEMVERPTSGKVGQLIALFLGAALFVVLIVCSNVANLMVVRAAERRTEMAVRASLGAGRWRLARQTLTESLILAGTAGILGTLASIALVRVILALIPTSQLPSWLQFGLDVRVLVFSLAMTTIVTVIVSLLPIRVATRFDLVSALRAGGMSAGRGRDLKLGSRRGLVIQLALSVALFMGAALLARSYQRLASFDFGYPADRIVAVRPYFNPARYPTSESRLDLAEQVVAGLIGAPGVAVAAVWAPTSLLNTRATDAATRPAARQRLADPRLRVDGHQLPPGSSTMDVRFFAVSDDYFRILGVRTIAGRGFRADDTNGSNPAVVVSRTLARSAFADANPLGRTLQRGQDGDRFTVIGVVEDVRRPSRNAALGGIASADVYASTRQVAPPYPEIVALADGDVGAVKGIVAGAVRETDPDLVAGAPRTMDSDLETTKMVIRIFGSLFGFFAGSALLLSIIGIYGVVAYGITQRTREIGIRMALGGTSRAVVSLLLREGAVFTVVGIVLGVVIAMASGGLLRTLLWGTSPLDPVVYVVVTLLFAAVATLACYLPARRAARVDPLVALRAE